MHNTGARIVANGLPYAIRLVDMEDQARQLEVPPGTAVIWDGTIYPWCNSDEEVHHKAFLVSRLNDGHPLLYLFQQFSSDVLFYSHQATHGLAPYSTRKNVMTTMMGNVALERVPNADIFIMKHRVWGVRASNTAANAQKLLDEAISIDV